MQNWRVSIFASEKSFWNKGVFVKLATHCVPNLRRAASGESNRLEWWQLWGKERVDGLRYPRRTIPEIMLHFVWKKLYLFLKWSFFWSPPFLTTLRLTDAITENARSAKKVELETYELCLGEISLKHFSCVGKTHQKGRTTILNTYQPQNIEGHWTRLSPPWSDPQVVGRVQSLHVSVGKRRRGALEFEPACLHLSAACCYGRHSLLLLPVGGHRTWQ